MLLKRKQDFFFFLHIDLPKEYHTGGSNPLSLPAWVSILRDAVVGLALLCLGITGLGPVEFSGVWAETEDGLEIFWDASSCCCNCCICSCMRLSSSENHRLTCI